MSDIVERIIQGDQLLTVKQMADILKVHPNTIRKWATRGVLATFRIGPRGDRRFLRKDLEDLMTRHPATQ